LFVVYRFTRPVLFYIPSDCVCTDYSDRIDGYVVLNPIRNRAPERAADRFFEDVRNGRKPNNVEPQLAAELASGSAVNSPRLRWQLTFREDEGKTVRLYYKLDPTGSEILSVYGEGMLEMKKTDDSFRAESLDVVW
jgi:hypothetical protein